MKPTKLELAWAAGLIDGEGCISLTARQPQEGSRSVTESYRLILKVTMCHEPTVRKLHSLFQVGTVHQQRLQVAHYTPALIWFCNAQGCAEVLQQIQPYLITKAEEAAVALEFLRLEPADRGGSGGGKSTTFQISAARQLYWHMLRDLKSSNNSKDRKAGK